MGGLSGMTASLMGTVPHTTSLAMISTKQTPSIFGREHAGATSAQDAQDRGGDSLLSISDYQDNRIWDIRFWLPQGFLPPRLSTSSKDSGCVQRSRT